MCDYTGIGNRVVGDCAGPSGNKISAESHSAWSAGSSCQCSMCYDSENRYMQVVNSGQ